MVACSGVAGSNSSVPFTFLKCPRTCVTIMWRTENSAAVCPGSNVQRMVRESTASNCAVKRSLPAQRYKRAQPRLAKVHRHPHQNPEDDREVERLSETHVRRRGAAVIG